MKAAAIALSAIVLCCATASTFAAPAYLDDRSTAAALVQSFYNAINRHEYARAYTYFDGHAPKPYDAFAAGYSDTLAVRVVTGPTQSDGAAGSIYYTLPVAIDATASSGVHRQFAGCYTTRLIEPGIQDPPVTPMFIFKASLHAVRGRLESLLPTCPLP